jgi:hypothetical protein
MKKLSYYKGCLIDARDAYRRNPRREYACAVRFAMRKVAEIEKTAFKGVKK